MAGPVKAAFTPGPWQAVKPPLTTSKKPQGWHVACATHVVVSLGAGEEGAANAALIAAAPELLEQTKLLERAIEYQIRVSKAAGDDEGANLQAFTLHLVREVIAKATGTQTAPTATKRSA